MGGHGSNFVSILANRTSLQVAWAEEVAPQVAAALAEEAARWDSHGGDLRPRPPEMVDNPLESRDGIPLPALMARALGSRVLVVDDNADMRDYLHRLLAPYWQVEIANDGAQALDVARRTRPPS